MLTFRATWWWVLILGIACTGCADKFTPTFTPNAGDSRRFQQNDFVTLDMQVMGQSMPINLSNTSLWNCEVVDVDENGDITLKFTAEQVMMDMGQDMFKGIPGMGLDMSFMNKAQDAMRGQSFNATVSPIGEIRRLEGIDALVNHVRSQVTLPAIPAAADMMENMIGEPMLRRQVEEWMAPYHQIEAKKGTTWTEQGSDTMGMMSMKYSQTYTVTKLEDGVATIAVDKRYEGGTDLGVMNARIDPKGNAIGTIEMDADDGWINTYGTQVDVTSTMTMQGVPGGMSMTMKITGSSSFETH